MLESMRVDGWNFLFHAGNELSDECGDRAVEGIDIPYDQFGRGGNFCAFLFVCPTVLSAREKGKGRRKRIEPNEDVHFGDAWKGKEDFKAETKSHGSKTLICIFPTLRQRKLHER